MAEKEFNLLDEPWIRVLLPDCTVREVSLTDALVQAHTFSALAGEMPTQDMAALRLLLAVLHTVFSRVDEAGNKRPVHEADDALDRWRVLWEAGRFPERPLRDYLAEWHERFYLFHPERPFYQVKQADRGTEFTSAKLNGAISESSNKVRLFSGRTGAQKNTLTWAEAARWLICLNGFDDTSAKPKQEGLPSPGAGWLGKLGLIAAKGENLFETLMLNMVMLNDQNEPWGKSKPVWEQTIPRTQERCEIPMPDNQAELLTLQSRRLLLVADGQAVTGYKLLGGDFFSKVNAFAEQMTLWAHVEGKGAQPPFNQPKRHDPSKQIWREFSSIASQKQNAVPPGVVDWQRTLEEEGILDKKRMTRFVIAGVQYGDKDFFVADTFSDALSFHLDLLTEAGETWNSRIEEEIRIADEAADVVGYLGANIEKADGGDGSSLGKQLKEQFYARIDIPFRVFLEEIDPADGEQKIYERIAAWRREEYGIAKRLGREAAEQSAPAAFVGRTVTNKKNGKEETRHYSVPEAYNLFAWQIQKCLKPEEGSERNGADQSGKEIHEAKTM